LTKASEDAAAEMEEASRELTITAGEWSDSVSRDLEALDIISDATEFDTYLEENGYSDDIKAGTFNISLDATFEEIAKEITK
jgi:cell division protein YceG involved in septum cleavage